MDERDYPTEKVLSSLLTIKALIIGPSLRLVLQYQATGMEGLKTTLHDGNYPTEGTILSPDDFRALDNRVPNPTATPSV